MAVMRLPQVDAEPVREVVRELRDLDLSRLSALRGDLQELELPSAGDLRRELERLDLPSAGDLRRELERLDLAGTLTDFRDGIGRLDLPIVRRFVRPPRRLGISPGPALAFGVATLVVGAVAGGVLAWLLHPEAGARRRAALRRRVHRLQRKIQHAR